MPYTKPRDFAGQLVYSADVTQPFDTRPCWLALCAALVVLGCRGDKKSSDKAEHVAMCAAALHRSAAATGAEKLATLTRGCSAACPALADYATALTAAAPDPATRLLEGCDLFCSKDAHAQWTSASAARRFSGFAAACDPAAYDLSAAEAPLVSDAWLALHVIHTWLEKHRASADQNTRDALAQAGQRAHFVLPLPTEVPGVYRLPASGSGRPTTAAMYVMLAGQSGELRAAAVPIARLRPGQLERRPVPGGAFPGKPLTDPGTDFAELTRLLDNLHPGQPASIDRVPLVLADQAAPASRLIAAAAAIEQPRVALAVAGYHARAHKIQIQLLTTLGSAAPLLDVQRDHLLVVGDSEDFRLPTGGDAMNQLASHLLELSVRAAPQNKLELKLHADASVADLVAILDVVARTKFAAVLVTPPRSETQP